MIFLRKAYILTVNWHAHVQFLVDRCVGGNVHRQEKQELPHTVLLPAISFIRDITFLFSGLRTYLFPSLISSGGHIFAAADRTRHLPADGNIQSFKHVCQQEMVKYFCQIEFILSLFFRLSGLHSIWRGHQPGVLPELSGGCVCVCVWVWVGVGIFKCVTSASAVLEIQNFIYYLTNWRNQLNIYSFNTGGPVCAKWFHVLFYAAEPR